MTDADYVWAELARHPIRRAMLGRERCDEIVATAAGLSPEHPLDRQRRRHGLAGMMPKADRDAMRRAWEASVREEYENRAGFAFMTMLLVWAIGAIVQALVKKWWEEHT